MSTRSREVMFLGKLIKEGREVFKKKCMNIGCADGALY
jgi:hypothetical protein